nr:hypothetical protein [Tanacetum cinerariifolium]
MGQDRQMQMVGANGGNPFRQYAGHNVGNLNGYNDVQNVRNQVIQNTVQNLRIQNDGNQNGQIAQPGINMGQDRQMQIVGGNGRNQFRQYIRQNAGNLNGYNAVQNVGNQVAQNPRVQNDGNQNQIGNGNLVAVRAEGNAARHNGNQIRCYNCRGLGHFTRDCTRVGGNGGNQFRQYAGGNARNPARYDDVIGNRVIQNAVQNPRKEEARIQLQAEEYDLMAAAADLDEIEEVNANCILMANLHIDVFRKTKKNSLNSLTISFNLLKFLQAQKKQQSLYDGKVLLEKHDPPILHDSEETLQLAQESRDKMKQMNKEIKPANYTKINHLSGVSSAHQELHKIVRDEIFPIVNQVDARVQNFELQFLKEAAKFFGDFKSLAKEANDSLAKHKALELEIKRLLKAVVSQDIMITVQNDSVVDTSDFQTELVCTKERFENYIIKKETEYAKLWNDWYKKCDECKYDKISYDKAYKDTQQKIERLQAQLEDLKGKSKDTSSVSDTRNSLSQKLENENVELEF